MFMVVPQREGVRTGRAARTRVRCWEADGKSADVAVVSPEGLGTGVQGQLDVVHAEGDVDVLVGGVVRGLDGADVLENALEHVIIPEARANIKYITMKLDENERSTQIRLMKVKDMMLEEAHHYKEREAERGA